MDLVGIEPTTSSMPALLHGLLFPIGLQFLGNFLLVQSLEKEKVGDLLNDFKNPQRGGGVVSVISKLARAVRQDSALRKLGNNGGCSDRQGLQGRDGALMATLALRATRRRLDPPSRLGLYPAPAGTLTRIAAPKAA